MDFSESRRVRVPVLNLAVGIGAAYLMGAGRAPLVTISVAMSDRIECARC